MNQHLAALWVSAATLLALNDASATSAACVLTPFPSSQLLNVSTAGWATKDEPLVACTILNPEIDNGYGVAFLTETTTEDAFLEIRYTDQPFPLRQADDWKKDLTSAQIANLPNNLRAPYRDTDAALVLHFDQALYPASAPHDAKLANHRFGVCAYGYPKSGKAWTSVSISTLRQSSCPWQNVPVTTYFER